MRMEWIYLSPHFDDVALSVGGLLWEQSQAGKRVSVWTICGGFPPPGAYSPFAASLHNRWQTGPEAIETRKKEDIAACQRLGANYLHFDIPDCIYRRSPKSGEHLYASEEELWISVHPDEEELIVQLAQRVQDLIPSDANIVCPLTLGDHVDHRLTRAAAEKLSLPLWYYADYPYLLEAENLKALETLESMQISISPEGLRAWQDAVAAYGSQISTFWQNLDEMRAAIQAYLHKMGGVKLFRGENQHALY
jgi:LmbE family N-acetylglucosaminyl deacetylase